MAPVYIPMSGIKEFTLLRILTSIWYYQSLNKFTILEKDWWSIPKFHLRNISLLNIV